MGRIQMNFEDQQLTEVIKKDHALYKINRVVSLESMTYRIKDLDRWISGVRAPFEGIFSKQTKRARYRGRAKVQYQAFMDSIVHNLKRLVVIGEPAYSLC